MSQCGWSMALAVSVAGSLATIASAQSQAGATSETGTLITRRLAQVRGETTLEARKTLREFGGCVVGKRLGASEALIDQAVDSKQYRQKMYALVDEECFSSGEMTVPQELLRGAVFEALYLREFSHGPNSNLKSASSFDYFAPYSRPYSEEAQNTVGLAVVADCAVRTSPVAAHALLTSVPGSPQEDRTIGELARILPGCVPPGRTFHFSRSIIRGSVAEAMLRLSRSTRQQQASASK